jgi:hypothetical protein
LERRVVAKTASYTVNPAVDRSGTIFTTRGAGGAITFTLPTPTAALTGWAYSFHNVVAQDLTVSAGTGKGIAFNNAACASLAATTTGQEIGAIIDAICDGTSWFLLGGTNGVTYTVA